MSNRVYFQIHTKKNCFSSGKLFRNSRKCQTVHVNVFPCKYTRNPFGEIWITVGERKKYYLLPLWIKKIADMMSIRMLLKASLNSFIFFFPKWFPTDNLPHNEIAEIMCPGLFLVSFLGFKQFLSSKTKKKFNSWLSTPRLFMSQHTIVQQWENKSNKSWEGKAICKQLMDSVVSLTRSLQALQSGTCAA